MSKQELTRRNFLLRFSAFGAAGTLLAACGGGESGNQAAPQAEAPAPAPAAKATCDDLTGLTETEKQMRTQLQYVNETPDAAKPCNACALWVPQEGNNPCGGCTLIKGPIAPNGYCISWAPKPTT